MANFHPTFLDGNKNEIALLLQMLGISRIESLSVVSLLDRESLTSREIEKIAGLHQPEVSVAMRPLCEQGIIESWDEKSTRERGRPSKYYRLCIPLNEYVKCHEAKLTTEFENKKKTIERLKEMN